MATKVSTSDLVNLDNPVTAVGTINLNIRNLATAIDNTLSRDGTSPNVMNALLDMNSLPIINLPAPLSASSPLRLADLASFLGTGTINAIPSGGTTNQVISKTSNASYALGWKTLTTADISDIVYTQPTSYPSSITSGHKLVFADSDAQFGNVYSQYPLGVVSTNPLVIGRSGSTIGSAGNGQIFRLTFTSTGLVGSPITISYTAGAAETTTTVATALATLVNNNTALHGLGGKPIFMQSLGAGVFNLQYDAAFAIGGATPVAITVGSGTTGTINLAAEQTPLDYVVMQLGRNTAPRLAQIGDGLFALDFTGPDNTGVFNTHYGQISVAVSDPTSGATRGRMYFNTAGGAEAYFDKGLTLFNSAGAALSSNGLGTITLPTAGGLYSANIYGGTLAASSVLIQSTTNGSPLADQVMLKAGTITLRGYSGTTNVNIGLAGVIAGQVNIASSTTGTITLQALGVAGSSVLTLPIATDTLVGKATTDILTNKTLDTSVGKGTWTASGTWTLPAHTLGGTISGGGNQINNVVVGASTPLAGTFQALGATTYAGSDNIIVTKASGTLSTNYTASAGPVQITYDSTGGSGIQYYFHDNAAGLNQKYFSLNFQSGIMNFNSLTDVGGAQATFMTMTNSSGVVTFPIATDATTSAAAAVVLTGGLAVGKKMYIADSVFMSTAAKTLVLKQGANGCVGTFVANGATAVVVSNTNVAVTDTIIFTLNTVGGTPAGAPYLSAIAAGTSFSVKVAAGDTSTYNYAIIKNAA